MKTLKIPVLAAALLFCSFGFSQLYLGGGVGNSFVDQTVKDLNGDSFKVNKNSLGWKAFAGYKLGFLSVEGGYRDLGTSKNSDGKVKSVTKGGDVAGKGMLKIGPFIGTAKAGAFFSKNEYQVNGQSYEDKSTDFMWGFGAGLKFSAISITLDWESLKLSSNNNWSQLSLNLAIYLGGRDKD